MQTSAELKAAYAECERIATSHYENFPVGSLLIPKSIRPHIFALYAFMRTGDDFADEPHRPSDERLRLLADWRSKLRSAVSGKSPTNRIFLALWDTIRTKNLETTTLELLLDAFEFDARGDVRFETFDDLHWYTMRSAEPVGQLVLALCGYSDAERIVRSNSICTALQLINFLQDAKDDLSNNRCYFPLEDLRRFGLQISDRKAVSTSADALIEFECARIAEMLNHGAGLPRLLRGRLKYEIKATLDAADVMLDKIGRLGAGVFAQRPKLSFLDKNLILLKALL